VKDMSKIKTGIAIFIVLLVLVVIYVFIRLPMYREPEVGGLIIEFKDGTTEPEVKAILENCNMTVNYTIDYNTTKFKNDNVQVGKSIICYIRFGDGSGNGAIVTEKDAIRIKNELKKNKKVLTISFDHINY
jgi:hypothetical protein